MIQYFINMCLCSGVFVLFYLLILEKEKFHIFNRYYLLLSLMVSALIPLISWEVSETSVKNMSNVYVIQDVAEQKLSDLQTPVTSPVYTSTFVSVSEVFCTIYLIVTTLLICWFMIRLSNIFSKVLKSGYLEYRGSSLVLTESDTEPFSFLNYIFINKKSFENRQINDEIIHHELAHTRQKHTYDIILLEIYRSIFWLNPFLFLYRNAIVTNHEFLADQSVINTYKDIKNYQRILLEAVKAGNTSSLGNRLTGSKQFNLTKKRLAKMTKQNSTMKSTFKIFAVIPVFILVIYLFSDKITAQNTAEESKEIAAIQQKENTCPEYAKVYCSVLTKYDLTDVAPKDFQRVVSAEDQEKMLEIFKKLTPEEQNVQIIGFNKIGGPWSKRVPTSEQLESWKDEKEYGVWINGERVENSVLNNHSHTDFSFYFISRLTKTAYNYGKHTYQLDLETNENFIKYNLEHPEKRYHIFYRRKSKS